MALQLIRDIEGNSALLPAVLSNLEALARHELGINSSESISVGVNNGQITISVPDNVPNATIDDFVQTLVEVSGQAANEAARASLGNRVITITKIDPDVLLKLHNEAAAQQLADTALLGSPAEYQLNISTLRSVTKADIARLDAIGIEEILPHNLYASDRDTGKPIWKYVETETGPELVLSMRLPKFMGDDLNRFTTDLNNELGSLNQYSGAAYFKVDIKPDRRALGGIGEQDLKITLIANNPEDFEKYVEEIKDYFEEIAMCFQLMASGLESKDVNREKKGKIVLEEDGAKLSALRKAMAEAAKQAGTLGDEGPGQGEPTIISDIPDILREQGHWAISELLKEGKKALQGLDIRKMGAVVDATVSKMADPRSKRAGDVRNMLVIECVKEHAKALAGAAKDTEKPFDPLVSLIDYLKNRGPLPTTNISKEFDWARFIKGNANNIITMRNTQRSEAEKNQAPFDNYKFLEKICKVPNGVTTVLRYAEQRANNPDRGVAM